MSPPHEHPSVGVHRAMSREGEDTLYISVMIDRRTYHAHMKVPCKPKDGIECGQVVELVHRPEADEYG